MTTTTWDQVHLTGKWTGDGNNIYPIDDALPHTLSEYCACQPRLVMTRDGDTGFILHQRFDGKELIERHGIQ